MKVVVQYQDKETGKPKSAGEWELKSRASIENLRKCGFTVLLSDAPGSSVSEKGLGKDS